MALKRTRSQTLKIKNAKRQNTSFESTGLLSPPATPSSSFQETPFRKAGSLIPATSTSTARRSAITERLLSVKRTSARKLVKLSSLLSSDSPYTQNSSDTNDESDEEIQELNEQEYLAHKEDISGGLSEEEIIKEVEYLDNKFGIKAPETNINENSIYTQAKKLFSKAVDVNNMSAFDQANQVQKADFCLVGREKEFEIIESFLTNNLSTGSSDFLYVSGPPGCGKTQQLSHLLDYTTLRYSYTNISSAFSSKRAQKHTLSFYCQKSPKQAKQVTITKINCMRLSTLKAIYEEFLANHGIIASDLDTYPDFLDVEEPLSVRDLFIELIKSREFSDNNVILLDELDALLNNNKSKTDSQELFNFFTLASQKGQYADSKLVLIGVANSLNLIERLSPRLRLNGLKTSTVQFLPYTVPQIVDIVKSKLSPLKASSSTTDAASAIPLITPSALQFCAKKIASSTGDLRKVFDILYKAIELVESDTKKKHLAHGDNVSKFYKLTAENAPKVVISHIVKSCSKTLNGVASTDRLKQLSIYQITVLIALAKLEQKVSEELYMAQKSDKGVLTDSKSSANADNIQALGVPSSSTWSAAFQRQRQSSASFALRAKLSHSKSSSSILSSGSSTITTTNKLYKYYQTITSRYGSVVPKVTEKNDFIAILSTLHTVGLVNVTNKTSDINIHAQTSLRCCGIGLKELSKFTEEKFEAIKVLFRA